MAIATDAMHELHGETMGTTWSARIVAPAGVSVRDWQDGVQRCLDEVDAQMSTYQPDSALSRYNAAPAGTWQAMPDECFAVIAHALRLARDTGGAYDPTVGPLVNLWGFGPEERPEHQPSDEALLAARASVGWWKPQLNEAARQIFQPGGVYIDLSSIAKGHGVDRVGAWLDDAGASAWLVEVGGEMKAHGTKPDGSPWRVGIERPDGSGAYDHVLALSGRAIATSGNYRRHYTQDGAVRSHHIDPRTGYPVAHAVASVSILAARAIDADPLGTAMTLLGPDEGLAFAHARDLAVLFVLHSERGWQTRMSPAFEAALRA
ncbi:FAD:protein FMN transferase [Dyella sp. 2RAB6]|uniref:FAD:protein FMN transferase n=1 Tax=Dyella sp. 2RAB6 TaxID=3232992 RepID=UPI003F8FA6DE